VGLTRDIMWLNLTLFKMTPSRCKLEYEYFGLSRSQRDYILMTVADVQKCNAGSITICPADRALYDTRSVTCESKLYFQTPAKDGL